MKNHCDERENAIMSGIAAKGFYVMYAICTVAIIVKLIYLNGSISSVAGETLAITGGSLVYLIASVKNGLFLNRGKNLTVKDNLILSAACSGVFSALFGLAISGRVKQDISIGKYIGMFFAGIMILGFVVTTVLGKCSEYSQAKNEKKYSDL